MKKNVKLILALALCLLMVGGVIACAAPDAPPPEPEAEQEAPAPEPEEDEDEVEAPEEPDVPDGVARITYMFWGDEAEIQNVQNRLDEFNATHPHIYVSPWPVDRDDITEILTTLAAAGDLPDTGFMTEEMLINWTRAGLIQPTQIVGDEAPRDIISFVWEGEAIAYSSCVVQIALYYNRDLFDAAGVDYAPKVGSEAWSWDEFIDVARTLTIDANGNNAHSPDFDRNNIEQYGVYMEPAVFQLEIWTISNGGGFFNPDDWSDVIIDNPESAEAIQRIADLYLVYGVMPRWGSLDGTIDAWFLEHNVAMAINGTWSIGIWLEGAMNEHGLNYSVGVLPSMGIPLTLATAGAAVQYEGSDYPEAAAEFLAWFAATENNWGLIEGGIWMPRYESWYHDEALMREWADNENHPPFEDFRSAVIDYSLNYARSFGWHWVPGYDAFLPELATILADVWSGAITAQEALSAGRPAIERAIGAD